MCGLRDSHEAIEKRDGLVVGVSNDSTESHARFRESYSLPFHLASDPDGGVMRMYDVRRRWGLGVSRITYLIDKAGTIQGVYHNEIMIGKHVRDVLAGLAELT